MIKKRTPTLLSIFALCATFLLGGCDTMPLLNPQGPIGVQEKDLIILSTVLMLIVVVPVIVLTLIFAYRYRASNTRANYMPNWAHSYKIEVVIWGVPCLIIIALGSLAWKWSHDLDPYKPLVSSVKPIEIDVVALDWKWLFIYPEQHVASMSEVAIPVNTPVLFNITGDSDAMNSFFIPQIGSQIYAMSGMRTQDNLIATKTGTYDGLSANYSGHGFSDMKFDAKVLNPADFNAWVQKAQASPDKLSSANYESVTKPTWGSPVHYYSGTDAGLFQHVIDKYMKFAPYQGKETAEADGKKPAEGGQMDMNKMDMGQMKMATPAKSGAAN
ncbi:MAG TPA: ubiquinol oxidase subunit II [Stellaceae bacterium]|nr:ubiquinol oxidase subunit II [Stellaceae bacterium]